MKPKIEDPIHYARDVVGGDPFAKHLGVVIEEVTEGYARLSLLVKPEYLNAVGRVHGGAVGLVLDQAFAVAANSRGISAVSLTMTTSYHAGAPCGATLVAEARPVDIKRKVSTWEIVCRTRDEDALVASARGIAYHQD
jgi:acyl-CoA thioesterase